MKEYHFNIEEALKFGWQKTKKHFWLVFFVMIFSLFSSTVLEMVSRAFEQNGNFWGHFFFSFFAWVFNAIVNIGIIHMALMLVEEKSVKFKNFFDKSHLFLNYLIGTLFYFVIVVFGLVLLIVPGIIFAIRFQFYKFLIIDKELNPLEALSESWMMTRGQSWHLVKVFFAIIGLNLLGVLALGVGLFITVPMTFFAYALIYSKLAKINFADK